MYERFSYSARNWLDNAMPLKRLSGDLSSEYSKRKRTKNLFSLKAFGHSLSDSSRHGARTGYLSADGRRAETCVIPIQLHPLSSTSAAPPVDLEDGDWLDVPEMDDSASASRTEADSCAKKLRKRKWYATTDANLRYWVANFRDQYLRVLVTCEGPMQDEGVCSCGANPKKYRCQDCYGPGMFCRGCIVEMHRLRPLCRIERWEQLLNYGWFPSTPDNPKSAITIATLKLFHAVSLQGKTTAYHFFNALAKITDNTGSRAFKRRYQHILRVVRGTLRTRFLKARKELARQQAALDVFSQAQKQDVPAWQAAVDIFEVGVPEGEAPPPNPYELPKSGVTLREIELDLLQEEHEHERLSGNVQDAAEETMTEFLMLGLEIEGQQRQLTADLLSTRSPTTKELTDFVTRRTRISQQIKKLRLLQRKYSPGAIQRLAAHTDPAEPAEAERVKLFLPSELSPTECAPPASIVGLAEAEARLHDAQCSESLDQVRHGLIVKKQLHTYKSLNSRRQHQNTRSRSLVDSQQRKIELAAGTYRRARAARLALAHIAGESHWRVLEKANLRLPEDEEEVKRRKQRAMKGKRKAAAQVNEGALALASRQAAIQRLLAVRFRRMWWQLTDRVAGPEGAVSSESSGVDEHDVGGESNSDSTDSDGSVAGNEEGVGEREEVPGDQQDDNNENEENGSEEGSSDSSADDMATRAAEMDELLALQTASISQFDDI
ncbi:hypothetical protein MSAN_00830000 [Mycena sanguinolenta]|uniref:CxC2-like cysteine cluster KDZ transposase-associated domain-containing protein n=1 Tax=Mycena sanguinolenta TaxID=230812 RepID=A0A8H7DD23_9AGAR|nr:hypothetical protein MSAN_00830000 [Mycena sanguinolenta]